MAADTVQPAVPDDPKVASILKTFMDSMLVLYTHTADEAAPVGTGFLISDDGKFVTAQHVLAEMKEDVDTAYGLAVEVKALLISGENGPALRVRKLWLNSDEPGATDVTVGILALDSETPPLRGFKIADEPAVVGDEVAIIGFSGMPRIIKNQVGAGFYLEAGVKLVATRITKLHPTGYTHVRGPVFEMEGTIDGGMSGGPIVRLTTAEVVGIASYSPNIAGSAPYCFGSVVAPENLGRVQWNG
jgi:hypothetical protein